MTFQRKRKFAKFPFCQYFAMKLRIYVDVNVDVKRLEDTFFSQDLWQRKYRQTQVMVITGFYIRITQHSIYNLSENFSRNQTIILALKFIEWFL